MDTKAKITKIVELLSSTSQNSWGVMDSNPKVFYHEENMRNFLMVKDEDIHPINMEIWPSLSCNARCNCTYVQNRARDVSDSPNSRLMNMEISLYKRIIREYKQCGGQSVTFTGGGEPTMHPLLPQFAKIANQEGLEWGLYSNGFIIDRFIEDLLLYDPTFIRISINAGSSYYHSLVYGSGEHLFNRVIYNIIQIGQAIQNKAKNTTLGVGYLLTPNGLHNSGEEYQAKTDNIEGISKTIQHISSATKLDYACFRPFILYFNSKYQDNDNKQFPVELYQKLANRLRSEFGASINNTSIDIWNEGFWAAEISNQEDNCISTPWVTSLTEKGIGYISSELNGSPQKNHAKDELPKFAWGDLKEKPFGDLWFGNRRRELAKKFALGTKGYHLPHVHKLHSVERLLRGIREIGAWRKKEVDELYRVLKKDSADWLGKRPAHWRFI